MRTGLIGLGKMGANMAQRLMQNNHEVVVFDQSEETVQKVVDKGAEGSESLSDLVGKLQQPRIVWMMIPAGKPVDDTIDQLISLLDEDDIVVDGGNSYYKDTLRRNETLREANIHYVDVGTSGGVWGLKEGYSMMVGGEKAIVDHITPLLETLAPGKEKGWGYVGPTGAGHFVKMVHNGIEYGMMEAYAEGFNILNNTDEFDLDLHNVAEIWRFGSVIRSWLLDLTSDALKDNPTMDDIAPYVADSGEGRWTAKAAIDLGIPAPVITQALYERFSSRGNSAFAKQLLNAMRNQFGGHAIKHEE